jgi:multisubunit Na+/H+ antiporter MnhG subunit
MKLPEIDPIKFYAIGKFAFFTTGLIGLIRVVDLWSSLKSYDIFSSLASSIFSFTLAAFFSHLGKKELVKELSDEDASKISDAIDKLNLGGLKK